MKERALVKDDAVIPRIISVQRLDFERSNSSSTADKEVSKISKIE
jgi:hypothetical protein